MHAGQSMPSTSGRSFTSPVPCSHFAPFRHQKGHVRRKLGDCDTRRCAVAESRLLDWLEMPADKVPFKEDGNGGLVLTKAIAKGATVLAVPASRWITSETVGKSPIGRLVSKLQPWLQITLLLMYEKQNARSQWRQYIDDLPSLPDTPLLWADDELEDLLGGTQLIDTVISYRQFFQRKFQDLDKQLFSQDRQLFPEEAFSEAAFLKMAVLLRSRIHSPLTDNDVALVPLADKVQHQRGAGTVWKRRPGGFGRGGEALVVEALQNLEQGQTLTMDYGPDKLDADILLNYGAIDEFVSRAGFPLTLAIPEDDRFIDDKVDILDINGFQDSHEFILSANNEPAVEMLAYLRLINLSGMDAFLLESLFRNEAWGFLQMPVSQENESAVFRSMIDGCKEALEGYGSTLSEDRASLKSAQAGSKAEKALRVRCGEKEALLTTLQFFEEKFERLDQLEYYQERRLKGLGLLDDDGGSTYDSFFKDGIA